MPHIPARDGSIARHHHRGGDRIMIVLGLLIGPGFVRPQLITRAVAAMVESKKRQAPFPEMDREVIYKMLFQEPQPDAITTMRTP
jgi:hypothetical protein